MPSQLRQKLHSDVACDLAVAWHSAPTALAVVGPQGVLAWNTACRTLLQDTSGDSAMANQRWLSAAVVRLLVAGQQRDVLYPGNSKQGLVVELGPQVADTEGHVLSLNRTSGAESHRESLAETVSTLSHELRTPLASMKSSLGLVLAGETGPVTADQSHFLGMTMRNIDRLERLVSDLLDISRQGTSGVVLPTEATDLGPVLREAVQMQGPVAAKAGLDFDAEDLPATLMVHLQPDRVSQILANIIGNAIKYTPPGGLVRVRVETQRGTDSGGKPDLAGRLADYLALALNTFTLVVEDSGPGLSTADQKRIFEPWFRAEQQESVSVPGAGLGLSITRSLVQAHGGRIRLLSAVGQGTTVRIELPQDPASERLLQAAQETGSRLNLETGGRLAILDGRSVLPDEGINLADEAASFQQKMSDLAAMAISSPVVGVVIAVVPDPVTWCRSWQQFVDQGELASQCHWQFPPWTGAHTNNMSIERLENRNL